MDFIRQFTAVAAVLSLLGLALWWLRRRGFASMPVRRSAGRRLSCLERLPLSPQHTLHLVKLDSRLLLVSSSPAGCSLVDRVATNELLGDLESRP